MISSTLTACLDSSDSSSGSSDAGAPHSIIGNKLVQTITANDGKPTTISVGDTITYQFIDRHTILGDGDHVVPTTSWSYTRHSGNRATVELVYHDGMAKTTDELDFSSSTRGTFSTVGNAGGTTGAYSGTFVVSSTSGGSTGGNDGSGDSDGGGTDDGSSAPSCETNNTGTLSFWVSNSNTSGNVSLRVQGLGNRSTSTWFSSRPTCGSTQQGVMTFSDVTATSYSYDANDQDGRTWGPGNVSVPRCGCMNVELY